MIRAGAISKGTCLLLKGDPYQVTEREFVNPGKGQAFVRLKLKSLRTGQVLRESIKTSEDVEEAEIEERSAQYLYGDADGFHFMDMETYEQFVVPREGLEHKTAYMKEAETYTLIIWEEKPIDIELPYKAVYKVIEAPEVVRGDTATGVTKQVTLETGAQVKVPVFIKEGDSVLVNTETGEYVERVSS